MICARSIKFVTGTSPLPFHPCHLPRSAVFFTPAAGNWGGRVENTFWVSFFSRMLSRHPIPSLSSVRDFLLPCLYLL